MFVSKISWNNLLILICAICFVSIITVIVPGSKWMWTSYFWSGNSVHEWRNEWYIGWMQWWSVEPQYLIFHIWWKYIFHWNFKAYVTSRFPTVDVSSVKQVLAYKCKENSTALKMKSIRYIWWVQFNFRFILSYFIFFYLSFDRKPTLSVIALHRRELAKFSLKRHRRLKLSENSLFARQL